MDHAHMDHSQHMAMDPPHDGGHGGMDDMCSMSMLFTWDTNNLCIVFRQWHIRSTLSLVVSLLAVVGIGIGYEALRSVSRSYEMYINGQVDALPNAADNAQVPVTESTPFLRPGQTRPEASRRGHLIKAILYAVQTFYAFMLMLIFMTYNGWVMVAVTLGAFFGYLLFGETTSATKDNACH
ncbi:copper transpport protein [Lecanicillium sp. MT-2017a]|nr:copper transpport protein [Lecanicillium sp. MT-2017a]